jgi:hypothetical protein
MLPGVIPSRHFTIILVNTAAGARRGYIALGQPAPHSKDKATRLK